MWHTTNRKALFAGLLILAASISMGLVPVSSARAVTGAQRQPLELWVPAQDTGKILLLRGGRTESFDAPGVIQSPHGIEFSPNGAFAYVADVGNGKLHVVHANRRQVVTSLSFEAGNDTHQGKPSPDGKTLLVARRAGSQTLFKVLADESSRSWTIAPERLAFGPTLTPVCSVFRADGRRAYVSLAPRGIAVVDVASMTLVSTAGTNGILPTEGGVACGMAESKDRRTVYVTSNGGGGHLYRLDTQTDTLTELPYAIGVVDLHYPALTPNEKVLYATSRGNDQLKVFDLTGTRVETLSLDATPGSGDQPDGVAVVGETVYVTLKAAGKLAILRAGQTDVRYVDLVPASNNAVLHVLRRPGCVVPNARGMHLRRARAAIAQAGCRVGEVDFARSRRVSRGRVISQTPRPGTRVPEGGRVNLVVSRGSRPRAR